MLATILITPTTSPPPEVGTLAVADTDVFALLPDAVNSSEGQSSRSYTDASRRASALVMVSATDVSDPVAILLNTKTLLYPVAVKSRTHPAGVETPSHDDTTAINRAPGVGAENGTVCVAWVVVPPYLAATRFVTCQPPAPRTC